MNFKVLAFALIFIMTIVGINHNLVVHADILMEETPEPFGGSEPGPSVIMEVDNQVRALYFYSLECPHCYAVLEELIKPMQMEYGLQLDVRLLEIGVPAYYELLINVEEQFLVKPEDRNIPTLLIGQELLIGEDDIRAEFPDIVQEAASGDGIDWPNIPGLDPETLVSVEGDGGIPPELCGPELEDGCETDLPIQAAYFYKVGCKDCSRVEADLDYLQAKYPQLIIEEFNITQSNTEKPLKIARIDYKYIVEFNNNDCAINTPYKVRIDIFDNGTKVAGNVDIHTIKCPEDQADWDPITDPSIGDELGGCRVKGKRSLKVGQSLLNAAYGDDDIKIVVKIATAGGIHTEITATSDVVTVDY